MHNITIAPDAFVLNTTWSAEEFEEYKRGIEERNTYGYYHRIVIKDASGKALTTPGTHMTHQVLPVLDRMGFPKSFAGKSLLDIGCNAGFYTTVAKLRGSARTVGVDHQAHYIDQARYLSSIMGFSPQDIEFRVGDGHHFAGMQESFDVVINTGVLYHLENPMDFLRKMAAVTKEMMYIESEALIDPAFTEHAWFIEKEYGGDPSNWWVYGPTCLERMIRAAGFSRVDFCGYVWKPGPGERTPEGFLRQGRAAFVAIK